MNIYGLVILVTLLFSYLLELITNYLNLKSIRGELPPEFRGVFDEKEYQKSQDYTKVKTRIGFITSGISLLATLVFWFAGGFNLLDQVVRSWSFGMIVTGLLYIGLLILLRSLFGLPFSVYSTFVIEERFGFNKTTPATVFPESKHFAASERNFSGDFAWRTAARCTSVLFRLCRQLCMALLLAGYGGVYTYCTVYRTDMDHAPFQ